MKEREVNLEELVQGVLAEETKAVLDYRGGSEKALDYLVTEVCKRSGGKVDPAKARRAIINKL